MIFTDTAESIGSPIGGVEAIQRASKQCDELEKGGWVKVPKWLPVPLNGYEYRFPGKFYAYMKPKPKMRHWLRYRFKGWLQTRLMERKFKALAMKGSKDE